MLPKVRQTQWGWAIPSHVSPVLVAEAPFFRGQVGSFRQRPPDQLVHAARSPNKTWGLRGWFPEGNEWSKKQFSWKHGMDQTRAAKFDVQSHRQKSANICRNPDPALFSARFWCFSQPTHWWHCWTGHHEGPFEGGSALSLAADPGAGSSLWTDLPAAGEETKWSSAVWRVSVYNITVVYPCIIHVYPIFSVSLKDT